MRITTEFAADKSFEMEGFDERFSNVLSRRDREYYEKLEKIMSRSMREAADIRKYYMKAMSDDSKITSHERNELINQLNEFIVSVIYFREALTQSQNLKRDEEIITETKVIVQVSKSGKFSVYGKLSAKDLSENKDFSHWHNELFIKNLKSFLDDYREALKDGVLSLDEVKQLYKEIAEILYDAVLIRYLIEYCFIDN